MNLTEVLMVGILLLTPTSVASASGLVGNSDDQPLAAVLAEPEPLLQMQKMVAYMTSLPREAVPEKLQIVESGAGPGKAIALRVLMSCWAGFDPKAAATESFVQTDRESSVTLIDAAYGTWARKDADAAAKQLQDLPREGVVMNRAIDGDMSPKTAIDYRSLTFEEKKVHAIEAILSAMTETSPANAVQLALRFQKEEPWQDGFYFIFKRWARSDLVGATRYLAGLDKDHAEMATRSIAQSLVWMDPKAALNWIGQLPLGKSRSEIYEEVLRDWAHVDPKAVIDHLQSDPPSGQRTGSKQYALEQWCVIDPKAAANWLSQQPRSTWNDMMQEEAIIAWAGSDAKAAVAYVQDLPSVSRSNKFLGEILGEWLDADRDEAEKWYNSQPHDRQLDGTFDLWLAQHDPGREANRIAKLPPGVERDQAMSNLLYFWPNKDPDALWDWAIRLPEGELKEGLLASALEGLIYHDASRALARLDSLPDGPEKDRCTTALAADVVDFNSDFAITLFNRLPVKTRQDDLVNIAYNWSEFDGKSAVAYGSAQLIGEARVGYLTTALGEWFSQDPAAASAWLQQLPRTPENLNVIRRSFECWCDNDDMAATAFILSLPAGKDRNDWIRDHIYAGVQNNPAKALVWIKHLPNSDETHADEVLLFKLWLGENPTLAKGALANSDLTPTERASLSVP